VGFAVGAKQSGVTLNLAASQGRGNADGSDVAWVNTEVVAGQQIQTSSGNDTTIRGGVLTAPQVTVTTGTSGNGNGNLTIESLQDTSQYKSQQKQYGGTFSVPIAGGKPSGSVNATHSNIESDYASVNQQSGIRAGDEGFAVNVGGDTTLTGGAITSTQAAVDQQKNSFRTEGTLTTSDIDNKAGYEAKSVGVNLGVGYSASGNLAPQGTGVGLGSDSDIQSSTTQAAISDIAGNKAARTGDAETGLVNRFDAERVQKEIDAQTQITQTFSTYAAKAVGDYAQSQLNQANNLKAEAAQLGTSPEDQQRALQLWTEAKQIEDRWGEGGSYRIALHTLTGGLSGGLSGALGGAATATAAPLLNDLQANLSKTLKQAGASDEVADGIAQGISTITAAGLGASVGMASGNGLAGAAAGVNVDANNRQLHSDDYKVARDNAKLVAKKLGITEDEAEGRIVRQLQRNVDGATAQQDAGKRDEPIISILGCGLLKCDAKSTDPNYWNPAYNAEYIKPNQSSYDKGVAQSNAGLTPQQIEERNNRAGAPIAKAGAVILGGYILAPTVAVIGTELIAFTRNPVLYCTANPTACIGAVDVAAGTAAGVPLTGVPVPHAVPNTGAVGANSAGNAAKLNMQLAAEQAAGVNAPNHITGYSSHALEQIAGRDGGIGVSQSALNNAWSNPLKIEYVPSKYGPTFRYTGSDAVIVVNTEGKVVTGWAKSSLGVEK
jgi:filamentous hemagglutinin